MERIARALSSFGYYVTILGWDRSGHLPVQFTLDEQTVPIQVIRLPIIAPFGRGLSNLPNLLRWQWGSLKWLVTHRRDYDLIHACDFDTILPALTCRQLWGKLVIYDIFDFYADHLRATPKALKRLARAIDLHAISRADAIILADDSRWAQISGAKPKLSAVIYNSPNEISLLAGDNQEACGESLLRVAYIGLLQVERGLYQMLEVMTGHPEWHLDLAGFGGDEEQICAQAAMLQNVTWHGRVPYERALQISQSADVLFATYDPAIPNHRYASPNKLFEAMLLGKPIIVARETNMDRMIQQADCGIVVDYGDVPALESTLLRLQSDIELRHRLGHNARQAYERHYSWAEMQARLDILYRAVLEPDNLS